MIPIISTRSRVGDVSTVSTSMLNDFSGRDFSTDPFMKFQVKKFSDTNKLLTEALNEKSSISALAPIDEKRDGMLRVIFHEVNTKELWPEAGISEAATLVANELDKYGFETIEMAYATESANINALLQDLKKPEVKAAINKLPGLADLVKKLNNAQDEFEAAYLQVVGKKIDQKKMLSASRLRRLIRDQINNELIVYLNAMALSLPDQYKVCADVVETIIESNNSKVRNRNKKPDEEQAEI